MALTELGFQRPTYDEILEEQEARAKTLFGETIDTSELTAIGKYIRINVSDIDALYQILEGVYYARFPNTASGTSLDRLCPFAGITRNAATLARHAIVIKGTAGKTVEAGFEVANEEMSIIFHTVDDYKIGSEGTVVAYVECNEAGTIGNVTVGSINTIVSPHADVISITHTAIKNLGKDRESDVDLRKRFNIAISGTGNNTTESIKGAIMRISNVEDCSIIENATSSNVGNCNPYSFECVVKHDGSDATKQLIAEAILEKKPLGISTSGTSLLKVQDNAQKNHYIRFTDAETVYIDIQYIIVTNSLFEADGEQQIAERLINYINNLKIGETIYVPQLYSCICITGVKTVIGLGIRRIGETAYVQTNLDMSNTQIARVKAENIQCIKK